MTEEQLIKDKIPHREIEGRLYFSTVEIKNLYPEVKFDIEELKDSDIGKLTSADNIHPYTDFDRMIKKSLRKK